MRVPRNKNTTISLRLDDDQERAVRGLARRRKSTVSDMIRDAVAKLVESEEEKPLRPYDMIADLIGSINDLPANLSEGTGDRFAEIVQAKAGRRG
ncbi:MAG: ribbon-helix-helix protein, CopG family [Thermoanaerobaculia bacterium]